MKRTSLAVVCALLFMGVSCKKPVTRTGVPDQTAPAHFRVKFETTKGPFEVEIHRDWAPIGADRFYTLVHKKYFDGAAFFRIVPGFIVQFGIAADPKTTALWKEANLADDPVKHTNELGTITFATAGPNTRTTQLFINLNDNARLDATGFAAFGGVISGMKAVEELYAGYGEAPMQPRIEGEGKAYLDKEFPKLDYIKTAVVE